MPTSVWMLGFPLSSTCIFCNCADACVRCSDCGPNAYLCGECTTKLHKDINHSHCPMLWKVGQSVIVGYVTIYTMQESEKMYVPFPKQIWITLSCDCATAYTRDVTCVDVNGMFSKLLSVNSFTVGFTGCFYSVCVSFCGCKTEAEVLLQLHLFPATPKRPQLAFPYRVLDWLEALMLECQVSVH